MFYILLHSDRYSLSSEIYYSTISNVFTSNTVIILNDDEYLSECNNISNINFSA